MRPDAWNSTCVVGFPAPPRPASPSALLLFFYLKKKKGFKDRPKQRFKFITKAKLSPAFCLLCLPHPSIPNALLLLLLQLYSPYYALMAPLLKGEMIQAPGMHSRAAAVHCTCSAEKTRHMLACILCEAFFHTSNPLLCTWLLPLSFPAVLTSPFFFLSYSHMSINRQNKISQLCPES